MHKHVLLLAGGGGHSGYAYALAQVLHKKVALSFLVPEGDTLSERRLRKFGEVEFLIKPRGPKTPTGIFAVGLVKALMDSIRRSFHEFDVVVSTGSNFCILPALMARMRGIPVVNIESEVRFTRPSRTALILQHFSTITALQWEEQKRLLRGVVVGPILSKPEIEPWNGGYILVTGGTYGHKLLFDVVSSSNLHNIVLQTGKIDPTPYKKEHPEWKVITFTDKFHELLAGAELVVTHFGFTVLEAAIVYKKPVVLHVNPVWTRSVGEEDAAFLARKVNAVLISELNKETLLSAIEESKNRQVPSLADGAQNLARIVIALLRRRH